MLGYVGYTALSVTLWWNFSGLMFNWKMEPYTFISIFWETRARYTRNISDQRIDNKLVHQHRSIWNSMGVALTNHSYGVQQDFTTPGTLLPQDWFQGDMGMSQNRWVPETYCFLGKKKNEFRAPLYIYIYVYRDHPLTKSLIGTFYIIHSSLGHDCSCAFIPSQQTQPSPSLGALRLCLHALLRSAEKFLATCAIKCASWSAVNRGTSFRTPCTSMGYEQYPSVANSNMMASRFL